MIVETRGQWIRFGNAWIDATAVVGIWRDGERTVVSVAGVEDYARTTDHDPGEILEAVHHARQFVDLDIHDLPPTTSRKAIDPGTAGCLAAACDNWRTKHDPGCPEALLQVDSVHDALPELAEAIGDALGWWE